jgi:hypothetical protein
MPIKLLIAGALTLSFATPIAAQSGSQELEPGAQLPPETLEDRRKVFAWLLGTWRGDHMFGSSSNRSGALVTFFLESDGTVSARLDKMSPWMEMSEERFADFVGKRFIRGINSSGPPRHVWSNSASGGIVFNRNTGEWTNLGIISVDRETGKLSHLGAMSDFSHWVKVSGGSSSNWRAPTPKAPDTPSPRKTAANQPGRHPAGHGTQTDLSTPSSTKKCDYAAYQEHVGKSARLIIYQFEIDTDEVATYDPDMPSQRLFPSPISGAADIPVSYMDFADYRALTRMEEITEDVLIHSGPDKQLTDDANEIRRLYSEARQSYDLSAQLADQRRTQCPKFSDPDAYPKVAEADAIMDSLRRRRDELLKPRLAEGERLNEKLTREFFSDLAEASSLDEKQKKLLADLQSRAMRELKNRLTGEAIKPRKIENLVPQLEALRDRYSKRESEGKKVSQETRDKDLKEALKRSGIDYDPSLVRSAKRDGQISMGKAAFDYLFSTLGPQVTGFGRHLTAAQSYFAAAKVTAESLNALKNLYSLFGTRDELMPVALAVQENRAYLTGLVRRYVVLEQEYAIMRKNFEDAITSGSELSETD